MKKDRIVITGMGAVTPVGIGVPAYWQSLVNGVGGVSQITRFDSSSLPVHIAAEVKDFDATEFLPKKLVRETDIFMHFALAAAQEALRESGCLDSVDPKRIGIVMGTSLSGITTIANFNRNVMKNKYIKSVPVLSQKSWATLRRLRLPLPMAFAAPV